ncbi:hypothetical protein [Agreia sp. COWG]|uniref:hypothetical protein n=1 Tax=Agreia sp. COWG TaxID=2773266 RepID=UPI001925CE8F|nr:hypothetical protein [Agreia sp. COWG]CAD5991279.1 Flagellar hook-associated protein flgK [Agreia sp. COWG]
MKHVVCQGKSFVTTDDVASAILNFSNAASRRGRVVRIDVPAVEGLGGPVVELILIPGESLEITDSATPPIDLDTSPLIRSLSQRRLGWLPHQIGDPPASGAPNPSGPDATGPDSPAPHAP